MRAAIRKLHGGMTHLRDFRIEAALKAESRG
jgi:hypothetical protein